MKTIEIENNNMLTINKIENIANSKTGGFISVNEYDYIKALMIDNKADLFNAETEDIPRDLFELLDNSEMYYGFNENEIKILLKGVEYLGYTFNYIDIATQDNGKMNHTVKPYALRKIKN